MTGMARIIVAVLACIWLCASALAQPAPDDLVPDDVVSDELAPDDFATQGEAAAANAAEQARAPERIEIGLSLETIPITSDFTGETLTIFGAIDNIDPLIQRQGRYDIFVVLDGPRGDLVARRKGRVFGIWMNVESQTFRNAPQSYLIASTRPARDVTSAETLARLALTVPSVRLQPAPSRRTASEIETYVDALLRLKQEEGLYGVFSGGVQFISQSLFRAELRLPGNVPLGDHVARAFLFRNGEFVGQTSTSLQIAKAGFEYAVSDFARTRSLYYGLASVLLALFVGWLGRIVFKRD